MNGLDRAMNGLRTMRSLLEVAGENIANSDTPGYHARRAEVEAIPGVAGIGNGARVSGVRRLRDGFLERALDYLESKGRTRVAMLCVRGTEPERVEFFRTHAAELGLRTEPY